MAEVMVPIRSVKQYCREFGKAIISDGAKPSMVKEQILDAFQKEIFGQITMKYHDANLLAKSEDSVDEATREGVRHILANADRKWKRLCTLFAEVPQLRTLIYPSELMERVRDIVKIQESDAKGEEQAVDMGEGQSIEIGEAD